MPWRTGFRLHGINLQLKINEKPDLRHHGVVQLEKLAKENSQANKEMFLNISYSNRTVSTNLEYA